MDKNYLNEDSLNSGIEEENVIVKTRKKNIFIFIIFVLIILFIIAGKYIYDEQNYDYIDDEYEKRYEEYMEKYSDEYDSFHDYEKSTIYENFKGEKENIIIKEYSSENSIICELTNNNDKDIKSFSVFIIYYDINKTPIDIEEHMVEVLHKNNKYYCEFDINPDAASFDFLLTKEYESNTLAIPISQIEIKETSKNSDMSFIITNNSDKKIDTIELIVVYYNSANEIYKIASGSEFDINPNSTGEINIWDTDESSLKYEVFINEAINYNYDY